MAKKYSSTSPKAASRIHSVSRTTRPVGPQQAAQNQMMVVVVSVLFLALAFISLKYFLARESWMRYGTQAQDQILNYPTRNTITDASTIASTIVQFPEGTALWKQPKSLQNYIEVISKKTSRDLVVIDASGMILADTISANVGQKWAQDKEGEVMLTIADGKPRSFQEISTDYPAGLMQIVVPVRDESGKIYGAVVMSSETLL